METFADWLIGELDRRLWNNSDLARAASVEPGTISRIISGTRKPGPDVCLSIARAFREPPEKIFRLAGLLPSLPPPVEPEHEALGILRQLPVPDRNNAITMLRALAGRAPATVREPPPPYASAQEGQPDDLERQLLDEFRRLPQEWQEEAIREIERLRRYSQFKVRIIGNEEE